MLRDKTLAIIGTGMMGGALASGLIRAHAMAPESIRLYDTHLGKSRALAAELGVDADKAVFNTAAEAAKGADLILIAVKPAIVAEALGAISSHLALNQLVISIAAGVRLQKMEALVPAGVPVIRVMPNTPALVGEGATAIAPGIHATAEHVALAQSLFRSVGKAVVVDEKLLDAVTGLSGSGPAYVYLLIEALLDGGVKAGLSRDTARELAAQTVYGAAKMVLESPLHPAELKDNVTTPGGTTIAAPG